MAWWSIAAGIIILIGFILFLLARRCGRSALWLIPLLFLAGMARMESVERPDPRWLSDAADGSEKLTVEGTVKSVTEKEDFFQIITSNNHILWGDKSYFAPSLMITLNKDKLPAPPPDRGILISAEGTLKAIRPPTNPGEFDYVSYYGSQKIKYQMKARKLAVTGGQASPYFRGVKSLGQRWSRVLDRLCSVSDAGIFKAVVLGDKSGLEPEIRELYQKNGIAHLLAISGLHVSMIGMGIYHIIRKTGAGFAASGLAAGALIITYGVLTGAGASTIRAVLMLLCHFLADYLGRTYDILSAMSMAGFWLAADSPLLLMQSGFQLSFGAVGAIGLANEYLGPWLEDRRAILKTLSVSLAIQLVTYPMILYHFFQYPIYGILLNLIVIPLMSFVVYSGVFGILGGTVSLALGGLAIGAGHYVLVFYQWLCQVFAALPHYSLVLGRPRAWQILLYYGVLVLFLWQIKRLRRVKWGCYLGVCALCFFLLWPVCPGGLTVTFLDVGQGDGIFVEADGAHILVDGGSSQVKEVGKSRLEPFLKSLGVSRLDYILVSHGDSDHISGVRYLLESCPDISVDQVVLPEAGRGEEVYEELEQLAIARGAQVRYIARGDRLECQKLSMTCLNPVKGQTYTDKNQESEVFLARYGDFKMLLTGDVEADGEAAMAEAGLLEKVWLLKAGHHGSKTSSSQTLLEQVSPKWAILSYGAGNTYGHPSPEVVERLKAGGAEIWHTARDGAVTVHTDGEKVTLTTFLER